MDMTEPYSQAVNAACKCDLSYDVLFETRHGVAWITAWQDAGGLECGLVRQGANLTNLEK